MSHIMSPRPRPHDRPCEYVPILYVQPSMDSGLPSMMYLSSAAPLLDPNYPEQLECIRVAMPMHGAAITISGVSHQTGTHQPYLSMLHYT